MNLDTYINRVLDGDTDSFRDYELWDEDIDGCIELELQSEFDDNQINVGTLTNLENYLHEKRNNLH